MATVASLLASALFIAVVSAASYPLPYPLSVNGAQIVGPDGSEVRLTGVGMGPDMDPFLYAPYGWSCGYKQAFQLMVANGMSVLRITTSDNWINNDTQPLIDPNANPDLGQIIANGGGVLEVIEAMVNYGNTIGLKFIIDSHTNEDSGGQQANGLWYDLGGASDNTDGSGNPGTISDATFLALWQKRAQKFAGNPGVIGYDIRNEPLEWACSWGDGNFNTDIRWMYERVGNAIQAIDPDKLIICEGPQSWSGNNYAGTGPAPWGDLSIVYNTPVTLNVPNKVVYSVHIYPQEVSSYSPDSGPAVVQQWMPAWGYLISQNIAPVWIGECGTNMQTSDSQNWGATFISFMNGGQGQYGGPTFAPGVEPISWSWWSLQPVINGANQFGILTGCPNPQMDPQQQKYWGQMMPLSNYSY